MSDNNKQTFFEKLRKGVNNIETEVKKLKELVENGFDNNVTEEDFRKAKQFDRELRQTYVSLMSLIISKL
jgi:benzoyl-CoA reductase/2-hydroxyglutaryl-CoA dehydratase subunit BcrC/BadD/HgdB